MRIDNKGLGAVVEEGKCVTAVFQDKQNAPEAIWVLDYRIATQTARMSALHGAFSRAIHLMLVCVNVLQLFN